MRNRQAEAGFTMFEALVAIALMGLILGALASVTSQWLPSWSRGLLQAQRSEQVAIALERLAADLSAAEFVSPSRSVNTPLFQGGERGVTFVRSATGPNSRPGRLEIVQIAEITDSRGPALVRRRAPFVLLPTGNLSFDPIPFADPVVLLRAPSRLAFAYADVDGQWTGNWRPGALPAAVRFDVHDAERGLVISTATRVHARLRAPRPDPVQEPRPEGAQAGNAPGAR